MKSLFSQAILSAILLGASGVASAQVPVASAASSVVPGLQQVTALLFERNQGQTDDTVAFITRDQGGMVFLTARQVVWSLNTPGQSAHDVLRMNFIGAEDKISPHAEEILPARVHYYIGGKPDNWRTDIVTTEKVRYEALYPGIDMVLYGSGQQLEYDFIIAAGADPGLIRLGFNGQQALQIDDNGNLVARMSGSKQVHRRPVAYQIIAGKKTPVTVDYDLHGSTVAFSIARYHKDYPLVIDPVVTYATYLGGSGADAVHAVATDSAGNFYVTGRTQSVNFPAVASGSNVNGFDAFVTRFDANGTIVYSVYLGSSDVSRTGDSGRGISVDSHGNIHVVGVAEFSDFPLTPNAYDTTYNGFPSDAFVSSLDPVGGLIYSSFIGGGSADEAFDIAVDEAGDLYITGFTRSSDFPIISAYSSSYGGVRDAFIVKLRPDSNGAADLRYSSYFGGFRSEVGRALDLLGVDQVYITGETNSLTGIATNGAYQQTGDGIQDAFVAHFDTSLAGSASLLAATYMGGSGNQDGAQAIAVNNAGSVYITGATYSTGFPLTASAPDIIFGGNTEAYLSVLSPGLDTLSFSTFVGGNGDEEGRGIVVGSNGRVWLTGWTDSGDLPGTASSLATYPYGGGQDAFVSKFDPGQALAYSFYLGGSADESAHDIARDDQGNLYVAGETLSIDLDTLQVPPGLDMNQGGKDGFVVRLAPTADVEIVVADNGPVQEGADLEYTIVITNRGPDEASGIIMTTSVLDDGLGFQSSTLPVCVYEPIGRIVTCPLGSLDADGSIAFSITTTLATDRPVTTAFTVSIAGQVDRNLSNNTVQLDSVAENSPPPTIIITDAPTNASGGGGGGGLTLDLLFFLFMAMYGLCRKSPGRASVCMALNNSTI